MIATLKEICMANTAVFGIYQNRVQVEDAVNVLHKAGFRNTDTAVLFSENQGSKDLAHERHTKAPHGAIAGAGLVAVVGGVLGCLAGLGTIAIPGVGPMFIAAGPIIAMLAGVGIGGTVGAIIGALTGIGTPLYEAKRYDGRMKHGGILMSVHCDSPDWVKRAKNRLQETGAEGIASTGEASADFAKTDRPARRHAERISNEPVTAVMASSDETVDSPRTDKRVQQAGV
jgi:hypothetical protein